MIVRRDGDIDLHIYYTQLIQFTHNLSIIPIKIFTIMTLILADKITTRRTVIPTGQTGCFYSVFWLKRGVSKSLFGNLLLPPDGGQEEAYGGIHQQGQHEVVAEDAVVDKADGREPARPDGITGGRRGRARLR